MGISASLQQLAEEFWAEYEAESVPHTPKAAIHRGLVLNDYLMKFGRVLRTGSHQLLDEALASLHPEHRHRDDLFCLRVLEQMAHYTGGRYGGQSYDYPGCESDDLLLSPSMRQARGIYCCVKELADPG